jgi:uncharacterized surface protein with fasciclin (FAS1) repeats
MYLAYPNTVTAQTSPSKIAPKLGSTKPPMATFQWGDEPEVPKPSPKPKTSSKPVPSPSPKPKASLSPKPKSSPSPQPKSPKPPSAAAPAVPAKLELYQFKTFSDVLKDPEYSTFLQALKVSGAQGALTTGKIPVTMLIPPNKAWQELCTAANIKLSDLLKDVDTIKTLVYYHVLYGAYLSSYLESGKPVATLLPQGSGGYHNLMVAKDKDTNTIGFGGTGTSAVVTKSNMVVGNTGVCYAISRVLLPWKLTAAA